MTLGTGLVVAVALYLAAVSPEFRRLCLTALIWGGFAVGLIAVMAR